MSGMFDNESDGNRRSAAETSENRTMKDSRGTETLNSGGEAGMFNNSSDGALRGGQAGSGMFSNSSDGANREAGRGGAGTFDNFGDTEIQPGNNAGMFDNSGSSQTRSGGGAGMFDNEGDGNRKSQTVAGSNQEKGVKGMLNKAKQAFVPGST